MKIGLIALVLAFPTAYFLEETRVANEHPTYAFTFLLVIFGIELFATFFCLVVCGLFARWVTFLSKNPIHNTKGYDADFSPDHGREEGMIFSAGYNRRWERRIFSFYKSVGLLIQDESGSECPANQ